jgi:hypothetical protein
MERRDLADDQRALLDFLLTADFEGREEVRKQADTIRTAGSSCDCGCPSFHLNPESHLPAAAVQKTVVVDAHGRDPGGNLVGVLLFVVDGYLAELEVFGYESSDFAGLPRPESLKISEWGESDDNGIRRLLNP